MDHGAAADFEAFVAGSGASLLRTAWLLTGDRGHAEDVVQTALERTAQRWTRLNGAPEAYARRCVINLATDHWRRKRSRVEEVSELEQPRSGGSDLGDVVAVRQTLLAELRTLPGRQRAVLVCRYFLDLDVEATALALDISEGTVKSTTSRALARLRSAADLSLSELSEPDASLEGNSHATR